MPHGRGERDASPYSGLHRGPGGLPLGPGPMGHAFLGSPIKPRNTVNTVRKLWKYFRSHTLHLATIFVLVMITSLSALVGPYLIGKAIDNFIIPKNFPGLSSLVIFMVVLYLGNSLLLWLQGRLTAKTVQKIIFEMRKEAFDALQNLPVRFFDGILHGDLMSRVTNDLDNISNSLSMGVTQIFSSLITLIGTVIVMLWLSPVLTGISMIVTPLTFLCTQAVSRQTRKYFSENQTILGELNGLVEENISGLKVVKIFSREEKEREKFHVVNERLRDTSIRAQIYSGIVGPLMNTLNNASFALVGGFGGWLAIQKVITVGTIASFITYSRQFSRPLSELATNLNMLQSAIASAERIFQILDEPPEPPDPPDAEEPERLRGEVEFRNVSFSYREGVPVLENVSFHVQPGQMVALVGPTGAGKTTIVNLLTRFYDIDSGTILIDGKDIRTIKRDILRSLLGIVLQDTYLFSESIRENIRYGRLSATDEEVEEAARLAHAESFILKLPEGYDTFLFDGGKNLSQGQRQLLAIARAILADPAILILDEATSNVDIRTEKYIQSAMRRLMSGRTSLVIAHRLSTIRHADMILVIQEGKVIERGTHEELLQKKGSYYRLYMSQFGGESLPRIPLSVEGE